MYFFKTGGLVKTFTYLVTPGSTWDLRSLTREHGHRGAALCIDRVFNHWTSRDVQGKIFMSSITYIEFFFHFEMWQFKAKKTPQNPPKTHTHNI